MKKSKIAKKAASVVLSLMLAAAVLPAAFAADGGDEFGISLISADVAACESQAALDAFGSAAVGSIPKEIVSDAHSGTGAVKATVSASAGQNLSYVSFRPTEKLVEGVDYYFSIWYKDMREETDGKFQLRGRTAASALQIPASAQTITPGGWTKYTYTFKATAQMATDLTFFYLTSNDITKYGDIYFDDITFVKAEVTGDQEYNSIIYPDVAACESDMALTSFVSSGLESPNVTRAVVSSPAHSGTGSVKVDKTASNDYRSMLALRPLGKLEEGAKYYFSIWYYDVEGTAGSNSFEFVARTSTGISLSSRKLSASSGWQKYECVFTPTADIANNLNFFYIRSANFTGTICFDDIVLKKLDPYRQLILPSVAECESELCLTAMMTPLDTPSKLTKSVTTALSHSGSGCIEANAAEASFLPMIAFKPYESLEAGESYYFSVWYNDVNSVAGNKYFEFTGRSGGSGISISNQKMPAGSGWRKYECSFNVSGDYAGFANSLEYFYMRLPAVTGKIYFDDITFKKIDSNILYENMTDVEVAACETQNALDVFNQNSIAEAPASSREISTAYAHNGAGSLKVTVPGTYTTYFGFRPFAPLEAGKNYTVSFWYYNPENITGRIFVRYYGQGSHAKWLTGTAYDSGIDMVSGGWNKYEFSFEATEEVAKYLDYFYVTTEKGADSVLYFDDLSVKKVPDTAVSCITDSFGEVEFGSAMTAVFDGSMNEAGLPTDAIADGDTLVNVSAVLGSDGKSVDLILNTPIGEGEHTISFTCKDAWGRDVAATASLLLVYGDYVAGDIAACESDTALDEFNQNSIAEAPASSREISTAYAHNGAGSLKVTIPGTYTTYLGFEPSIPLETGEHYTVSFWYYNPENITGRIFVRYYGQGSHAKWLTGTAYDSGIDMVSDGWNKYEFSFEATEEVAKYLDYFYVTTEKGAGSVLYFDDLSLVKIKPGISAEIYDASGVPVTGWQSGELTAKVKFANNKDEAVNMRAEVVFANYSGGRLVSVNTGELNETVSAKGSATVPVALNVADGDELKVFVWDSAACTPLLTPALVK